MKREKNKNGLISMTLHGIWATFKLAEKWGCEYSFVLLSRKLWPLEIRGEKDAISSLSCQPCHQQEQRHQQQIIPSTILAKLPDRMIITTRLSVRGGRRRRDGGIMMMGTG